jgi:hypothetical protein
MANLSVLEFAGLVGAKSCGAMVTAVGLPWPPPPAVSLRFVMQQIGLPLAPVNLGMESIDGNNTVITDASGRVPLTMKLLWQDAGTGTEREATSFELTVDNLDKNQLWGGRPFSGISGVVVGMFPDILEIYARYQWTVLGINQWGRGPAAVAKFTTTMPAPPQGPSHPHPQPGPPISTTKGTLSLILDAQDAQFGVQGVSWIVWPQTFSGFGQPLSAFGISASIALSAPGQYQITAQVSVTRLATFTGEIAEFIGDTTGPSGNKTIVFAWGGGDVTKRFRVMTQDDGGGLYHATIVLES